MLFGMLDMPLPMSNNVYTTHLEEIETQSVVLAKESMKQATDKVRSLNWSVDNRKIIDGVVWSHYHHCPLDRQSH